MRHLKRKRNLGISPSHRRSLLTNLAVSILDKERIITTVAKAKEVRGVVERLITFGKKGDVHSMRIAARTITDKTLLKKLFSDIAPSFKDREGGYTRILKLGERKGDNAPTAIIELTGRDGQEIARQRKKKKKQEGTPEAKSAPASQTSDKTPKPPKSSEKSKSEQEKEKAAEKLAKEKKATPKQKKNDNE